MNAILNRIANLIDIKSIVTLSLTLVFCVLSVTGVVPQEFLVIYTMIIGFYFGTQTTKKTAEAKPTERAEPLPEDTDAVNVTQSMDQAMANAVHPPDLEAEAIE